LLIVILDFVTINFITILSYFFVIKNKDLPYNEKDLRKRMINTYNNTEKENNFIKDKNLTQNFNNETNNNKTNKFTNIKDKVENKEAKITTKNEVNNQDSSQQQSGNKKIRIIKRKTKK
jgi:hypothetical protein